MTDNIRKLVVLGILFVVVVVVSTFMIGRIINVYDQVGHSIVVVKQEAGHIVIRHNESHKYYKIYDYNGKLMIQDLPEFKEP